MNLKEFILDKSKKPNFTKNSKQFCNDAKSLNELFALALGSDLHPIPEYASWLLIHVAKSNSEVIQSFEHAIIDRLLITNNHTVQRNLCVLLLYIPFTKYKDGLLYERLFSFFANFESKVALRVYSLYKISEIVGKHPELENEVLEQISIIQEQKLSPGMKVGIRNFQSKRLHH